MVEMKSNSPSAIAAALIEILNRLTPEEKKEFARAFNWDEFERIKKEIIGSDGRRFGDPKLYVQGSPRGLDFEVPEDKLIKLIKFLSETLPYDRVNVFIRQGKRSEESSYAKAEFQNFLAVCGKMLEESYLMIEFGGNTLISGGGGCLDLELEKEDAHLVRMIAETFLKICGFAHRFSRNEFSAIVWEDELEVEE
jgi:hypothetical protein